MNSCDIERKNYSHTARDNFEWHGLCIYDDPVIHVVITARWKEALNLQVVPSTAEPANSTCMAFLGR